MILFFIGFSVAFNIALICYAWSLFKRVRNIVRKSANRVVYTNYAKEALLDKKDIKESEHGKGHYSKILKCDTDADTDKLYIRENGEALTIPDMHN